MHYTVIRDKKKRRNSNNNLSQKRFDLRPYFPSFDAMLINFSHLLKGLDIENNAF